MLNSIKNSKVWIPIAIFLFAFLIRVSYIDLNIYVADLVQQIDYADRIASGDFYLGGMVPAQGSFITQQTFGPFHFYLLSLTRIFSLDYLYPSLLIVLISSLTVLFTYFFVNRFFSFRAALLSSILFLVSSWHVLLYSKYPWATNYLPIIIILIFICLFMVLYEGRHWFLLPLAFLLGISTHPYIVGLQIFPVVFLALLPHFRKIKFKILFLAFLIFLLTFMPFVINSYLIGSNPVKETFDVLFYTQSALRENSFLQNIVEVLAMPFIFSSGYFGGYLTTFDIFEYKPLNYFYDYVPFFFAFVFLLLTLYFFVVYVLKSERFVKVFSKFVILILWLIIPIIFMLVRNKNVQPQNLIVLFPVFFIIISISFFSVYDKLSKNWKKLFAFFISFFILSQVFFIFSFYSYLDRGGYADATYTTPYKYKLQAVKYIINDNGEPVVFMLQQSRFEEYDKLFASFNYPIQHVFVDSPDDLKYENGYFLLDLYPNDDYSNELRNVVNQFREDNEDSLYKSGQLEVFKLG